jgi:hypothetical protein
LNRFVEKLLHNSTLILRTSATDIVYCHDSFLGYWDYFCPQIP